MIQKKFLLGDKWLYYKIYSGPKTLEDILIGKLYKMTTDLVKNGIIEKWFFIRYYDPDPHLRLRFFHKDAKKVGATITALFEILRPFFDMRIIWKIETSTYIREIERYGENTIELVEDFFYYESQLILDFLKIIKQYGYEEEMRWLFALKYIDSHLGSFNYSSDEKQQLLQALQKNYSIMYGNSSQLKKQLAQKHRQYRARVLDFMTDFENNNEYLPMQSLIDTNRERTQFIFERILEIKEDNNSLIPLDNLNSSLIHMFMNRLFRSKNNLFELVCYDFLNKFYITRKYKS